MNPTENRGPSSGQPTPTGQPGLPPIQSNPMAAPNTETPSVGKQDSFLDTTLKQLNSLTKQYAQDPYMQTQEIERLKAAYVSREFGRTLKIAENG